MALLSPPAALKPPSLRPPRLRDRSPMPQPLVRWRSRCSLDCPSEASGPLPPVFCASLGCGLPLHQLAVRRPLPPAMKHPHPAPRSILCPQPRSETRSDAPSENQLSPEATNRDDLYAARRRRPFCRRLLMTARPDRVPIRARKPCFRLRRRVFG